MGNVNGNSQLNAKDSPCKSEHTPLLTVHCCHNKAQESE